MLGPLAHCVPANNIFIIVGFRLRSTAAVTDDLLKRREIVQIHRRSGYK